MTNLEIATAYVNRVACLNFDAALSLTSDTATFQGPDGTQVDKATMAGLFSMMMSRFAGPLELEILSTVSEGRRVAIEAVGQAPIVNGHIYRNRYHYAVEIDDGLIVAFREYCCTKAPDVIFA
jgi:ketosteroid isomerase-like protein